MHRVQWSVNYESDWSIHPSSTYLWRSNGNADVHVVSVDNLVLFDGRIDDRLILQSGGSGFDEGGHETELQVVLLLELFAILLAQVGQVP